MLVAAPAPPLATIPGTMPNAPIAITTTGDWTPDMALAVHDAKIALDSIDWSKHDLVMWVPGTDNHSVHPVFAAAVHQAWSDGSASLSVMNYMASWDLRKSGATGVATLKLVLAGIAAHGGNYNVMLGGESQGAWVIGEAMADPMLRAVVHRAVIMGHPFVAAHHYDDGHDPGIVEINNPGDQVSAPVKGDVGNAIDAMAAMQKRELWKIGAILKAGIDNPNQVGLILLAIVRATIGKSFMKEPHEFSAHMTAAVEFLKNGVFNDGTDAVVGSSLIASEATA